MNGEIGTLQYNGKDIGGFIAWEIFSDGEARADGFWLFADLPATVTATFYRKEGDRLILFKQNLVKISAPACVTDKLIQHRIVMVPA
jgi:hypothetical protein